MHLVQGHHSCDEFFLLKYTVKWSELRHFYYFVRNIWFVLYLLSMYFKCGHFKSQTPVYLKTHWIGGHS